MHDNDQWQRERTCDGSRGDPSVAMSHSQDDIRLHRANPPQQVPATRDSSASDEGLIKAGVTCAQQPGDSGEEMIVRHSWQAHGGSGCGVVRQ